MARLAAMVRILGMATGILLGLLLMAAVMAGAGAQEFPAEVRFLQHFPLLMKEAECLENGKKAEWLASCEIRIHTASPTQEKALYIVFYSKEMGYVVYSSTLITTAADPPRASLPDDLEVIIKGICESEALRVIAPTRCELTALRNHDGVEKFYIRLLGSVPGGTLFPVLPGELIFPSFPLFFKK